MDDAPIACALSPDDLEAARGRLLPGLVAGARERSELVDGFRWTFDAADSMLGAITAVVEKERRCCPFLRFVITVPTEQGHVALDVTGPAGTKEFLDLL